MRASVSENRMVWLAAGLAAGLAIAYFWPPERAYATNADRDANFVMVTIPVGTNVAGITDALDGVFILDFSTGMLKGAVINRQTGQFAALYSHDLGKDFDVDQNAQPRYAMCSGYGQVAGQAGLSFAAGTLYVAELSSGKLAAYTFPWKEVVRPGGQQFPLRRLHMIQWRPPTKKDS